MKGRTDSPPHKNKIDCCAVCNGRLLLNFVKNERFRYKGGFSSFPPFVCQRRNPVEPTIAHSEMVMMMMMIIIRKFITCA